MFAILLMPEWLTGEKYITLATWGLVLCTFLLFVATVILWLDSRSKGQEQQERWEREDSSHEEQLKPKYRFGLKLTSPTTTQNWNGTTKTTYAAVLWIANLGITGLYVEALRVKSRSQAQGEIAIQRLVAAGSELDIQISDEEWSQIPGAFGLSRHDTYLFGYHEVWLLICDSTHEFETERILYQLLYLDRNFSALKRGSHEDRQAICPKCGQVQNMVLPATRFLTEAEVQTVWQPAMADLERTCPFHASNQLKPIGS